MRSAIFGGALALVLLAPSLGWAAIFNYTTLDPNGNPVNNPDASGPSGNVNAWLVTLTSGNSGQNGSFSGNSASNGDGSNTGGTGAGNPAWALYANSDQTARATMTAMNTLSDVSALTLNGQYISLDFDNGFIDNGKSVGVNFVDSGGITQLTFSFVGNTSFYRVVDDSGLFDTSVGFTDNGFNLKLALTGTGGAYTLSIGSATKSGILQQNTNSIASINVFNFSAGGGDQRNLFFNNLTISTNAVPEASPALAIPLMLAMTGVVVVVRRRWQQRRQMGVANVIA